MMSHDGPIMSMNVLSSRHEPISGQLLCVDKLTCMDRLMCMGTWLGMNTYRKADAHVPPDMYGQVIIVARTYHGR